MSALVTQREWASQLGISVDTFQNWRKAGRIPLPLDLPGWPRWSAETVARVTRELQHAGQGRYFRTATRRRNRLDQPVSSRRVKRDRSLEGAGVSPQDVGVVHGESVREGVNGEQGNSLAGMR